jgi:hypothetical protein
MPSTALLKPQAVFWTLDEELADLSFDSVAEYNSMTVSSVLHDLPAGSWIVNPELD